MVHPLETKIRSIRRQIWTLVWTHGLARTVTAVVSVVLAAAILDYLLQVKDPGLRILFSAAVAAAFVVGLYRYLLRPLRRPLRSVDIAQRIERAYPELEDRLSSAIEFLAQSPDDRLAGSSALRRAVVVDATARMEDVSPARVLDRRAAYRAARVAGLVIGLGLIAVFLQPQLARIAVARLVSPFGETEWPRKHNLRFVDPPRRLAVGEIFEVELEDTRGDLPDSAQIHYRYRVDGRWTEEVEPMHASGERMFARREPVTRPFQYRAVGGDDDTMPWIELEVVEPPRVHSFQVVVAPPAYTGFPASPSDKRIRALRGSRAVFSGVSTKPLGSAHLNWKSGDELRQWPAVVEEDAHHFRIADPELQVAESGEYWFTLVDESGLTGGADTRWNVQAVADNPPTVSIEQPAGSIFVTPEATVEVGVLVKDDLRVRQAALRHEVPVRSADNQPDDRQIPLFTGPESAPAPEGGGSLLAIEGHSLTLDHTWSLEPLGLHPGQRLALWAVARDYAGKQGETALPRWINIITRAELEDRLAERQAVILAELGRALKMQQEARSLTKSLEIQLQEVGRLAKTDIDRLQADELKQRQVQRMLTSPSEGVRGQIDDLLAQLASNKIENPDIHRRMRQFRSVIEELGRNELPLVAQELVSALKTSQAQAQDQEEMPPPAGERVESSLTEAGAGQDRIIERLEQLLGDLSQWADYRRFARELRRLVRSQRELQEATAEIGKATLGRDLDDLSKQEAADLKKLLERQQELAREFDKLSQGMERMAGKLSGEDPLAAATLEDALHLSRKRAVSAKLHSSGTDIEQNRLAQAVRGQEAIAEDLEALLEVLSGRADQELGRLVKELKRAEEDLVRLRKEQKRLRLEMEDAAKEPDPEERRKRLERLVRKQRELEEEIRRFARRLKRLQAAEAEDSTSRGADALSRASTAAEQDDAAGGAEALRNAGKDLEEAQQQLAQARRQAEADLANAMLARFEDAVQSMLDRQQRALRITAELEERRKRRGELDRQTDWPLLQDEAKNQQMLAEEAEQFSGSIGKFGVYRLALETAAREMRSAAGMMQRGQTDSAVQRRQQNALHRLKQLMRAFEQPDDQADAAEQAGASGAGGAAASGENVRDLTELRLLKLMQEDLNHRTQQLEALAEAELTPAQREEYEALSKEQGQLADLVFDLVRPVDTSREDDPENLPDLLEEDSLEEELPLFDLEGNP